MAALNGLLFRPILQLQLLNLCHALSLPALRQPFTASIKHLKDNIYDNEQRQIVHCVQGALFSV